MSSEKLQVIEERAFKIGKTNLKYFLLEDNRLYISDVAIRRYIGASINDVFEFEIPTVIYLAKSNKWGVAYYIEDIPILLINLIEKSKDEIILNNVSIIAMKLMVLGFEKLTGERIISEESKEATVKFDDLLSGLLKVPPPKKEK